VRTTSFWNNCHQVRSKWHVFTIF